MSGKIKPSLLDIITGLIALIIIDSISRYIYFDYVTCAIITAFIYILVGIIRGGKQFISLLLRVLFINIFAIISIKFIPLPTALFLPIVIIAIIFTFIGLYIRSKWTSYSKIKNLALAIVSLIIISILSIFLYPRYISDVHTEQLNQPAAEFEFVSFEGDSIKSINLKESVIILDFWDSGCGPCIASMPDLEKLYSKYEHHPNVNMYCVNVGWKPIEKEKKFIQTKGYDLPFVYDRNKISEKLLGFGGAGYLIIIDKKYNTRILHKGYDRAEDFVGSIARHIENFLLEN